MWIGSGRHYSFLNQQMAAGKNLDALLKSLLPLLEVAGAALEPPLSSPSSSSPPSSASLSPSEGRAGLAEISQLYASRYAPEALADVFAAKVSTFSTLAISASIALLLGSAVRTACLHGIAPNFHICSPYLLNNFYSMNQARPRAPPACARRVALRPPPQSW